MLLTTIVSFMLLLSGNCEKFGIEVEPTNFTIITCLQNVVQKYFAVDKKLVYVNMDPKANLLLKMIHSTEVISVTVKTAPTYVRRSNLAYFIAVWDVPSFRHNIIYLNQEANWNPYARFFVTIRTLEPEHLFQIFDIFLSLRVINAVVMNASDTAELYTYNPYENYACGKYYTRLIEFGKCLEVTADIYPQKVTTGLRNCFFNVSIGHWPPYSIDPTKVIDVNRPMGTEQYIFQLISEIEQFRYKFYVNYDPEAISVVSDNMSVTGPMLMLANNKTDVMLGGLMLIPSRANLFFPLFGHLDNVDELRLMVKRAEPIPAWKDFYYGFSPMVWVSLFFVLIFYSALSIILLRAKDKGRIVLILLDNLLSHGSKFRCRQTVKCVFLMWMLFAFLIDCFYTTTLMSLTTKPVISDQIENEETMKTHALEPCVSTTMDKNLITSIQGDDGPTKDCEKFLDSIKSVSESYNQFTLVLYSVYLYNKQKFYDEYGRSPVYSFASPYSKVIYAMYFPNGFPMNERLHVVALRIREAGLSERSLKHHFFYQKIKYHFRSQDFEARFAIPWYPYVIGLCLSCITFVVEVASKKIRKVQTRSVDK